MQSAVSLEKQQNKEWKQLYQIGSWSAFLSLIIMPISAIVFFIWPQFPDNEIMASDKLAGLMSVDILYLVGSFFAVPIYLVLFISLYKTNKSLSVLALIFGLIGFISLIISRPTIELLNLADQYQSSDSSIQKEQIVTSFNMLLTYFHGTAYMIHYIIGLLSLLLSSIVMLNSNMYSKKIAYIGIATNLFAFTYYIPTIGAYLSLISVIGYAIWWVMLGLRFKSFY